MTDITEYLESILSKEKGEDVTSAIVSVLTVLKNERYTTVDITNELSSISESVYGKNVKRAIYDALVALSKVEPIGEPYEPESDRLFILLETSTISSKDYGEDIRLAVHDALLKLACYKGDSD